MWDGLQIIKAVIDGRASVKVLDLNYIDLETPMGRGFMAMLSALAEDERLRIFVRAGEKHRGGLGAALDRFRGSAGHT